MYSASQLAKKYISFYLKASSRKGHGIHSPFVFDFIKHIKNDKSDYEAYKPIEEIRKQLLKNKSIIPVQDFGAGSAVIKSKDRFVYKIAQSSLKSKRFARLFFRIIKKFEPPIIIELGTSFGITTAYMAAAGPQSKIYSLEGAPAIAAIAKMNFEKLHLQNIGLIAGDFKDSLPKLLAQLPSFDFAFIDGNHRKAPTLDYFKRFKEKRNDNSLLIFDDIHWSNEMEEAWQSIQQDAEVTLTIDLFYVGIVFFKKEFKVKQHFSLRF
ncbi:MAG: class I SAM-dependent methyltransferase [Niastella sp.]|nr:class I SAM-dependent methyltransferase [Niastella sp.]